jgi:predicted DNA-binding transcriptional regulator YafY
MNADLVRAISEKRLIEFVYRAGRTRIVEPHDYGLLGEAELLLAFQLSGESRSGAVQGWKHFDVAQIRQLRVLERRFAGSRADHSQHHRSWDRLFARVAP